MLLRWMVTNLLREAAQNMVVQAVSRTAQPETAGGQHSAAGQPGESDEPPIEEPPPPCDAAMIFALGVESGGMVDLLSGHVATRCPGFLEHAGSLDGCNLVVADGGVGREAAAQATADVIALRQPGWIISAGFAGALSDELRRGHILMADCVVDQQGGELAVGLKMDPQTIEATRGLHVGRLLTVDRIVRTPQERRSLAEKHDALACDMETAAVAEVCCQMKTRFLSVRIISDAVDDRLPPEVDQLLSQKSLAGKLGAATGAIFKRPGSVKDMWKLREDALKASDRLAKFLRGVLPQLMRDAD